MTHLFHSERLLRVTALIAVCLAVCATTSRAQLYILPDEDITADAWSASGEATLWQAMTNSDDDVSYAWTTNTAQTLEVGLEDLPAPSVSTGHYIEARWTSTGSGGPQRVDLYLYEAGSLIATWNNQAVTDDVYDDYISTEIGAGIVTQYTDLSIRLISDMSDGEEIRITMLRLRGPPAAAATVPSLSAPTSPFADIGTTNATLGATIDNNGGAAIGDRGTVWGAATDPTNNIQSAGGTATGVFSHVRTDLSSATKYYYRGYATNSEGIGYSPNGEFFTEPTPASSVLFYDIGISTMTVSWVSGDGLGALVVVKEAASVTNLPTDGSNHVADAAFSSGEDLGGNAYVAFRATGTNVTITGLSETTTYYVAVFEYAGTNLLINYQQDSPATNSQITAATPLTQPNLSSPTAPFADIGTTNATLGATVDDDGGGINERGTVWGLSSNPTNNALAEGGTATGVFSHVRTDLSSATKYFYRGYATNSAGIGYSADGSFYTEPTQASTVLFYDIGVSTATVSWVSGNGLGALVVIKEATSVTNLPIDGSNHLADAAFSSGEDLGGNAYVVFRAAGTNVTITGLSQTTDYYVAVYEYAGTNTLINYQQDNAATGSVTTVAGISEPGLSAPTAPFADIGTTNATLGATIDDDGGGSIGDRGTVWGAASDPTNNVQSAGGTATGVFSHVRTDLASATKYYYRGYATNSAGIGYSPNGEFYTEPTQASAVYFYDVGVSTMTVSWVSGDGLGALVVVKAAATVTNLPTDGSNHVADAAFSSGEDLGGNAYVAFRATGTNVTITGLAETTTYYVAVFEYAGTNLLINYQQDSPATNSQTTAAAPVTAPNLSSPTAPFADIGTTNATLGATIDDDGGATIGDRGTVWGAAPDPTGNVQSAGGTSTGVFSHARTDLSSATKYIYRGYATNIAGIGYSPNGEFYTEPTPASSVLFYDIGVSTATVSWASGNGLGALVVIKEAASVTNLPIDGSNHVADAAFSGGEDLGGNAYVVFRAGGTNVTITGLSQTTDYYVAVYEYAGTNTLINYQQDNAATGSVTTLSGGAAPTLVEVTSPFADIGTTNATLGATITDDGGPGVDERGTVWGTSPDPTGNVLAEGGTETGTYFHVRTNLSSASLYYFRGYAVNGAGTGYSTNGQFYTEPTPATSVGFTVIMTNRMTISWFNGNGSGRLVVLKAGSAVTNVPLDGSNHVANSSFGSGEDLGGSEYVVYRSNSDQVTVSNLLPSTTYYVAVYEYSGAGALINYQQDAPTASSYTTKTGLTHNELYVENCIECHAHDLSNQYVPRDEDQQNRCFSCHSSGGPASAMKDITNHVVVVGGVTNIVDCGSCHEVHDTMDVVISTNVHDGATGTNMAYIRFDMTKYRSVALTNTVFLNTNHYAFASNAPPWNGVCQSCHTNTTKHRNDNTTDNDHEVGNNCMACHTHLDGFQESGGDCIGCHTGAKDGKDGGATRRGIVAEFSTASHVAGPVTTNDCAVCHYEAIDADFHMNNQVDLRNPDNASSNALISFSTNFWRDTSTNELESWVVDVQSNFCFGCHDADGATATAFSTNPLRPFSSNSMDVANIYAAFNPTNSFHHAVRAAGNNPYTTNGQMVAPWNQNANHDTISCFDCHGDSGHGGDNPYNLRVEITNVNHGSAIEAFCTICHADSAVLSGTDSNMADHNKAQHQEPSNVYSCRGCHAGQVTETDAGITNGAANPQILIHGGNFIWTPSSKTPGTNALHFMLGGWLDGWQPGLCYDGNCDHHSTTKGQAY